MNLKNYDDLERKLLALGIPLLQALHINRLAFDAGKQDKLRSGLIKMLMLALLR
jgi:hypothetical protein